MKTAYGDVIDLHWDCDYTDNPIYIKGHVNFEHVQSAIKRKDFSLEHKYGRLFSIGLNHEESFDGITSVFRVVKDKRPSYYAVTEVLINDKE